MVEDAPGAGGLPPSVFTPVLLEVAQSVVEAVLRALAQNPPDGVTSEDVEAFQRTELDALVGNIAGVMQPYGRKVLERLGRNGRVWPAEVGKELVRHAFMDQVNEVLDLLAAGKGWAKVAKGVGAGPQYAFDANRVGRLRRVVSDLAIKRMQRTGVGGADDDYLDNPGTFQWRNRFVQSRLSARRAELVAAAKGTPSSIKVSHLADTEWREAVREKSVATAKRWVKAAVLEVRPMATVVKMRGKTVRRPSGARVDLSVEVDADVGALRDALLADVPSHIALTVMGSGPDAYKASPAAKVPAKAGARSGEGKSAGARLKANLEAMRVLASTVPGERLSVAKREVLAGYSGWGGLSLDRARGPLERFRGTLPIPEERGLIHEYYTPRAVCEEVVRVLQPYMASMPTTEDGRLVGLEPSAGIGRFLEASQALDVDWTAVEYSALSSRLLRARFPGVDVFEGPFEKWVADNGGRSFSFVLCNPPYGARGASVTQDPVRAYRERKAYAYFLRRAGDLLAPGGIGAFLIPSGLMTGRSKELRRLRETLLVGHHLMGAYRLPSGLFPGAMLVTDLLFVRRRGEPLAKVVDDDARIADGRYFVDHPEMVLGDEVGKAGDDDDQTAQPRWGYQVVGEFTGLPDLIERPHCDACPLPTRTPIELPASSTDSEAGTEEDAVGRAMALGARTSRYLRRLAEGEDMRDVWPGLHADLVEWHRNLRPDVEQALRARLARDSSDKALGTLLSVFTAGGQLIEGLAKAPTYVPPYPGSRNDIVELAEWIYRLDGVVNRDLLAQWHAGVEGEGWSSRMASAMPRRWVGQNLRTLLDAGWYIDGAQRSTLVPARDYLSGLLWPKVDQIDRWLDGTVAGSDRAQLERQRRDLVKAIAPVQYGDIDLVAPHLRYVPTDLVAEWLNDGAPDAFEPVVLVRKHGFLLPVGSTWDDYGARSLPARTLVFLGFVNNDKALFKPDKDTDEPIADARRRYAEDIGAEFTAWVNGDAERQDRYTTAYNRALRGYVEPEYSSAPLAVDQWSDAITPRPHQAAGARRVIANRRGLLAFGVGVGKTYTGLLVVAKAREEGWARRPIVLVPNSLAWKWYKDFAKVLPDYRVAVVGSSLVHRHGPFQEGKVRATAATVSWIAANKRSRVRVQLARTVPAEWTDIDRLVGDDKRLKGHLKSLIEAEAIEHDPGPLIPRSRTDTPEERAEKWRRFQAGEVDAVILTYSALGRTRLDEAKIREYADRRPSIRRQVEIDKRNASERLDRSGGELVRITESMSDKERQDAEKKNKQTERQRAIAKEGAAAWIAELLELPEGHEYDPGITWEDIGCDLLVVDEAQNFKNLYTPERRDGGVPKFMGGNQSSTRAWQLDFRAASVRSRANGRGICLLSATPAKNSPLEFYSLLSLLGEDVWGDVGIDTVEAFIATFLRIEQRLVVNHRMVAEQRSAVTGFTNLDVLRDIIFRYAEFKSPEDVGLKLPKVEATPVWVDLDARQEVLYEEKAAQIEELLKDTSDNKAQGEILGLMMRLAMITLHPGLDKTWKWSEVKKAEVAPSAPKIAAMVARVRQQPGCGHIIFAEPVASHWWMQQALVEAGVPEERIAILNGVTAKNTAKRQDVAEKFNGDPDNDVEPAYDIVIANSIAYEGVDLQTRTCAIHHMDLPWEPATIEQRNGRGVRQGNTLANLAIYFYLARNSMDGARYSLIQGKHGWMKVLLDSQIKESSNPLATSEMGPEDLMLLLSRDPEETRKVLQELRAREELKAQRRVVAQARRKAKAIAARFESARRLMETNPDRATTLRREGEVMLRRLLEVDPATWPWVGQVVHVRGTTVHFPEWTTPDGAVERVPVLPMGHCVTLRDPDGDDEGEEVRIGQLDPDNRKRVGMLRAGELVWISVASGTGSISSPRYDRGRGVTIPMRDFSPQRVRKLCKVGEATEDGREAFADAIRYGWGRAGWSVADDVWREAAWPAIVELVYDNLGKSLSSYRGGTIQVPVAVRGGLRILTNTYALRKDRPAMLPPTDAGYARFLELAPASGLKWSKLNECALWWWARRIPRGLLADAGT